MDVLRPVTTIAAERAERAESMTGRKISRAKSRGAICLLIVVFLAAPAAALERNAGKYGAMFYFWYDRVPATTIYQPSGVWDIGNWGWWDSMVTQAKDAGLGWLAAGSWGQGSNADPAALGPLLAAIDRVAPRMKVAFFDDTTSEVLRKNFAHGHGWNLNTPFDLADEDGTGEGGLAYFYEQQWKRFFQTVPAQYRLTIDGRPVVFMWHGGAEFYSSQNFFHELLANLRAAVRRDFGVNPFVIVEESWLRLDPATEADAAYDWFQPHLMFATVTTWNGFRVGHTIAGYDCSRCSPAGPIITRQNGAIYHAGLQAVAVDTDLVLIEALNNVDENAHLVSATPWGKLYLAITKWFASNVP